MTCLRRQSDCTAVPGIGIGHPTHFTTLCLERDALASHVKRSFDCLICGGGWMHPCGQIQTLE